MRAGTAYYNEHDAFAAAWLRELIADGLIAPGEVDERSIEDVLPSDLAGFVQCHFFAGIGIWSLALRQAGWPDDEPIWTGSCPCQPFSAAGKGGGFTDERHLWPAFHWLIEQCGPELVLGEQVASKDGLAWLDLVSADVEASGYAFGAADTCAAGFGAPHIRQRLYWMADATSRGRQSQSIERPASLRHLAPVAGECGNEPRVGSASVHGLADALPAGRAEGRASAGNGSVAGSGKFVSLADANDARPQGHGRSGSEPLSAGRQGTQRHGSAAGSARGLAHTDGRNASTEGLQRSGEQRQQPQDGGAGGVEHLRGFGRERRQGLPRGREHDGQDAGRLEGHDGPVCSNEVGVPSSRPGPLNGLWRDADWLCCTDGKWRPVAPGTFPLAPAGTVRNRVGLLRGAGNAINLAQAQGFVEAVIEVRRGAESIAA